MPNIGMPTPQTVLLVLGVTLFFTAALFYYKDKKLAGSSFILFAFLVVMIGSIGPDSIKELAFKQNKDGTEMSLTPAIDTPQKISNSILVARKIERGFESYERKNIVKTIIESQEYQRTASDYFVLATDAWRIGDPIEGLAYAQQGIRLKPTDNGLKSNFHYAMGTLLTALGPTDVAIDFFDRAIKIDATFAWPYIGLGNIS